MIADFILRRSISTRIILDHRVGEELLAHRLEPRLRVGGIGKLDVEDLALTHRIHAGEAERAERALDRQTLRIENAVFQRDEDARLHAPLPDLWVRRRGYFTSTGPPFGARSFSFRMPRRRATS